MADKESENKSLDLLDLKDKIFFLKGLDSIKSNSSEPCDVKRKIKDSVSEAMNAKNVAFLMGSGCSSYLKIDKETKEVKQVGIATMKALAQKFLSPEKKKRLDEKYLNAIEKKSLKLSLGINLTKAPYKDDLEALMEVLFSWKFALRSSSQLHHKNLLKQVESSILKLKSFLFNQCVSGEFSKEDNTVLELYETFYRKLISRDRSLPRPWIFTTNYDVFNETAMDRLGLPYFTGFMGSIERRFNPSIFRYALAEQMDVSSRKWSVVDGFIYLCKLHGSINWIEDNKGLFPVRESYPQSENSGHTMIYPTPAKHASSFSTPYSDLFREFQSRIVQEQSVLLAVGYSFGDQHINNIIFQALTIPTFRLIIFGDPTSNKNLTKLVELKDPRIWIIGGKDHREGKCVHHFEYVIQHFMSELPGDQVDTAIKKVLTDLFNRKDKSLSQEQSNDS